MIDLAYLTGTAAFFAVMLAYVAGCERLGRRGATAPAPDDPGPSPRAGAARAAGR